MGLFLYIIIDAVLAVVTYKYTAFILNVAEPSHFVSAILIGSFLAALFLSSFYKTTISYIGVEAVKNVVLASFLHLVIVKLMGISFAFAVYSSLCLIISIIGYRVIVRETLYRQRHSAGENTLVYGAGSAGVQFGSASMQSSAHTIVGYIDDDSALCRTFIHGRKVSPSKDIPKLVQQYGVKIIVIAIPSIARTDLKPILESLIPLPVRIVKVPTFEDLINGAGKITQTQEISIDDLIGRDSVMPVQDLMLRRTQEKTCLVTGAGGSIGSELCRQIAQCNPARILLFDLSEPALFNIQQELLSMGFDRIHCVLGNVTDSTCLERLFADDKIDSVYHAAAYKHVPMVEANPLVGITNNLLGTQKLLAASIANGCDSFTLISTDKAVRPTNIMGASKRLAEMACQIAAQESDHSTIISLVRFGNVLGSSGSVVPTFKNQIDSGGPVTLTHLEMTRYFMTIREAAQLVIQASAIANTGDLFLLDMGDPVKIYELAERLIRLSGKTLKLDPESKNLGEIEIKVTGLRPGEKLYEELLVDSNAEKTVHSKIMLAREGHLTGAQFNSGIEALQTSLLSEDLLEVKRILATLELGYQPRKDNI